MNNKLSITDLADQLSKTAGIGKKEAVLFVKTLFDIVEENLIKDKIVKLKSFGTFKLIWVESRRIANVNTGEIQEIPGHYKTTFTPESELSEAVNEPFAHLETVVLDDEIIVDEPINRSSSDYSPVGNISQDYSSTQIGISYSEQKTNEKDDISQTPPPKIQSEIINSNKEESLSIREALQASLDDTSLIVSPIKQMNMKSEEEEPGIDNETEENDEDAQSEKKVKRWIIVLLILALLAFAAYFVYYNSKGGKINISQAIPTYEEMAKQDSLDKVTITEDSAASTLLPDTGYRVSQQAEKSVHVTALSSPIATQSPKDAKSASKQEVKPAPTQAPALPSSKNDQKADKEKISFQNNKTKEKNTPLKGVTSNKNTPRRTKETTKIDNIEDNKIVKEVAKSDKSKKITIAKEVMKPGSRLTLLAKKYYGNKAFWVYIYKANKAQIKDPNNVPAGTELIIPAKETYSIDSESNESIDKAKSLAKSILE